MRHRLLRSEALLAWGVIAFGLFCAVETVAISAPSGYARVGPSAYPWAISFALIVIGVWLLRDAWTGAWTREEGEEDAPAFDPSAFAYISLGLVLDMLLMQAAGFVVASTVLFICVARAFGGRRIVLSLAIGCSLALAAYVGFDYGLDLNLPAGVLEGLF